MPLLALLSVLACTNDPVNDSAPVQETGSERVDADQDGFHSTEDCDDDNAAVNPYATVAMAGGRRHAIRTLRMWANAFSECVVDASVAYPSATSRPALVLKTTMTKV